MLLRFCFRHPPGFDIANPLPTLGVSAADLASLFRLLFSRGLFSWAGEEGLALSALLGLHGNLPGLQGDWPTLSGNLFGDPLAALRAWLNQLAMSVSADDRHSFRTHSRGFQAG